MTITNATNKAVLLGDGVMGSPGNPFTFSFNNGYASGAVSQATALSYFQITFTAADGTQETVDIGPGVGQAQVTLNAASAGSLWGMGGSIVYQPGGAPIPGGTTLTVLRKLPATQTTSLQNQASYGQYAASVEQALDRLEMQVQQLLEAYGRAIVVNVSDASDPDPLPPAAQRAGKVLVFDSEGNPTAADGGGSGGSGTISSAMAPVVAAATLALARQEMGLRGLATLDLGAGLQAASNAARVNSAITVVSTDQSPVAADHRRVYVASSSATFTLPVASETFNGFEFTAIALGGTISLTPDAADTINGLSSGQSLVIPSGAVCRIRTNGANPGTWYAVSSIPAVANRYTRTTAAGIPDVLTEQQSANLDALRDVISGTTGRALLTSATVTAALSTLGLTRYSFSANRNGIDQTGIVAATPTKVNFATEEWDAGDIYDTGNSTLTPPAGRYRLTAQVRFTAGIDASQPITIWIYRNGAAFKGASFTPTGTQPTIAVTALVNANGTDEFEVYAQADGASAKTISGSSIFTFFTGEAL